MDKFLSLIFKGLSLLMKGLMYLLGFAGGACLLATVIRFLTFWADGFEGSENATKEIITYLILGIVFTAISVVCALLDEKFEDTSDHFAPYKPRETYTPSSRTYSFPDSYSDSSSYDSKYHDELDAVQHAMWITDTYGEDWKGYDAEAPGPDPETFVNIDL